MFEIFLHPGHIITFIRKYQMNNTVILCMSAYRHIPTPARLAADILNLPIWQGLCFGLSACFDPTPAVPLIIIWIIGYYRHVRMSAYFEPPPILPTNTQDIHMMSTWRHIFDNNPKFFMNYNCLSACQHIGICLPSPPPFNCWQT